MLADWAKAGTIDVSCVAARPSAALPRNARRGSEGEAVMEISWDSKGDGAIVRGETHLQIGLCMPLYPRRFRPH
ncbi:hypothetical protein GmRootV35_22490 [Variovorax sp. V35]